MDWLETPSNLMTHEWLCELITSLEDANGVIESSWIEFKSEMNSTNVAEAVGALANADGGLVVVGVLDEKHAKDKRGGERVLGLSHAAYEKITSSLLSAFGRATPEVRTIPVDGNPDLVSVVILVDPERFEHPVVVHGKVKQRIGSDSINADRGMIERLVERNKSAYESSGAVFSAPTHLSYVPYWEDEDPPFAAVRVASSLILGRAVLERQVISSDMIDITTRFLKDSLLPNALWFMGPLFDQEVAEARHWNLVFRSARQFRLNIEPKGDGSWPNAAAGGGVAISLNGQRLDASTTIWFRNLATAQPLVLSDLYAALMALLLTTHDILEEISAAMVPNGMIREGTWGGTIQPEGGQAAHELGEIIDFRLGNRISRSYAARSYEFPDFRLTGTTVEAFDELVRLWLDIMCADCGVINYETALAAIDRPYWFPRFSKI